MAKCFTFLAVLFLKSWARSTILKLGFMNILAISLTHSGIVAENNPIWILCLQTYLTLDIIFSMSSLNPNFNITSASSSTIVFSDLKSILPLSIWSRTLPVVPTNKSTPLLSILDCSFMLYWPPPPYTVRTLNSFGWYLTLSISAVIWSANSLVGAIIIACTYPVSKRSLFRKYSMTGSAKANVFPEPVRSLAIKCSPLYIG